MSNDEPLPFYKNEWMGFIYEHKGTPLGLFTIRCKKGHRVIHVTKLSAEQVTEFDPDVYWNDR